MKLFCGLMVVLPWQNGPLFPRLVGKLDWHATVRGLDRISERGYRC
jgi:hypothetical protein